MNKLELRYRSALRWYPTKWRALNEDAVVGTLLDQAEGDQRTKPARGELADLRSSALLSRLGPFGRVPASIRDRAAALAFGLGSGIAITALVALAVQKATITHYFLAELPTVGPFVGYSFLFYGAWILSFVAAMIGWKWAARLLAIAAIAVAIVLRLTASGVPFSAPTTTTIVLLGALALISFIGNPFATHRGRVWIAVSAVLWAAFMGFTIWYQRVTLGGVAGRTDWFVGTLWQWLYWLIPFALVLALVLRGARKSAWSGAILILLVPVTLFVVFGWSPQIDDLIDRATLLAIAIGIVCAVYFVLRVFGVRIRITRV
jgi:hypothetical protein